MNKRMRSILNLFLALSLMLLSIPFTPVSADSGVPITLEAPAEVTSTFSLVVNIGTVVNLASWQFDLYYDHNVVQLGGVTNDDVTVTRGTVGEKAAPVTRWGEVEAEDGDPVTGDMIRVTGKVSNVYTQPLNGSGFLAVANFIVTGQPGDSCDITIDGIVLADKTSHNPLTVGVITNTTVLVVEPDEEAPAAPANLNAWPGNQQVLLAWDANSEEDLSYYMVYQSTDGGTSYDGGVDVGNTNNYIVTDLTNGVDYTFGVSAVDESGNESEMSDNVTSTPDDEGGVPLSISAPAEVPENGEFDVFINIGAVENLVAWGFTLNYDNSVAQVQGVQNGNGVSPGLMGTTVVPVSGWVDATNPDWSGVPVTGDMITITGIGNATEPLASDGSAPSYMAVVHMDVLGNAGDTCILNIDEVTLINDGAEYITALVDGAISVTVMADSTAPIVTGVNPEDGMLNVPTNSVVSALFSESLLDSSIDETSFTLEYDSTPVNGTVVYDDINGMATFVPGDLLLDNTTYTATLINTITDQAGNPLVGNDGNNNYSWSFTTGFGTDFESPTVVMTNPEADADNIPTNTDVSVLFSETLNPLTLNNTNCRILMNGEVVSVVTRYNSTSGILTIAPMDDLFGDVTYTVILTGDVTDIAGNPLTGNDVDGNYSWEFTTGSGPDEEAPSVVSVNPTNYAEGVGTNITVSANFSENLNPMTINETSFVLTDAELNTVEGTVVYEGNSAVFIPDVELADSTVYTATLVGSITDIAGNALTGNDASGNYVWTFTTGIGPDVTAPQVSGVYYIETSAGVATNTSILAVFTEEMNPASITTDSFMLTDFGGTPVAGTVNNFGSSALFTPSAELLGGQTYNIIITTAVADIAGNTMEQPFQMSFVTSPLILNETYDEPLTVSSTIPVNEAEDVAIGTDISVTFSRAVNPATLTNRFKVFNGDEEVIGVIKPNGANVVFNPVDNLTFNTTYTATVYAGVTDITFPDGNSLESDYTWTFTTGSEPDTTAPEVSSTSPANGATEFPLDRAITATFTEEMDPATIGPHTISLQKVSDNSTVNISGLVYYSNTTASIHIELQEDLLEFLTAYRATISTGVADLSGNHMVAPYSWTFTTAEEEDTTAPIVSSTLPRNGATGVALDRAISATFTEAMDDTTVTNETFTLEQVLVGGNIAVEGTVNYYGTTAVFTPLQDMAENTTYLATITSEVRDQAHNYLAEDYTWTFTTGFAPDETAPLVTFTDPMPDEEDVAFNKAVSATFSEPMKESSITTASFKLADRDSGVSVPGAVHYTGTTATYVPLEDLAPNTWFTATITTAVMDLAGNHLALEYSWDFATGTDQDLTAPVVSSTRPEDNETNVALNRDVTATFTEAMDPASITAESFYLDIMEEGIPTRITGMVTFSVTAATYMLVADLLPNTEYQVTITTGVTDLAGNHMADDYVWRFFTCDLDDTVAPMVTSTVPEDGAIGVPIDSSVSATFSEVIDISTISNETFTLWNGETRIEGLVSYYNYTATFIPAEDLAPNTTFTGFISKEITDLARNTMEDNFTWSFTTGDLPDETAPWIKSTNPSDNETGVLTNRDVTATFSEAMDPATININTFTLKRMSDNYTVPGAVTYYVDTATYSLKVYLDNYTLYQATISRNVRDLSGNRMDNDYVWTFTTGDTPDEVSPYVVSQSPEDNTTGVAPDVQVVVTFSEPMTNSTINNENVRLLDPNENAVPGTVTYNTSTLEARFVPLDNLEGLTTYTIVVDPVVSDLAGNTMGEQYSGNFTTHETVPPAVISQDPEDGADSVAITTNVVLTFSEALDPATVSEATVQLWNDTTQVAGEVTYDSDTLSVTFDPTSSLGNLVTYTVVATADITDLLGNHMAADYNGSFTTIKKTSTGGGGGGGSSSTSVVLPVVTSVVPAADATGVDVNTAITAAFSTTMNSTTLTDTTFTLKAGDNAVAGTVTYSINDRAATFTPTAALNYGTLYTATISKDVKNTSGQNMAADYSWSFTTGAKPVVVMSLSGFTTGSLELDSEGYLISAAKLTTKDGAITFDIAAGTKMINSDKTPMQSFSVKALSNPPAAPSGNAIVAAYTFGAEGANFNPALTMTINYSSMTLPAGVAEKDLVVYVWNGTEWKALSGKVDTGAKTVTVSIYHFSDYALMGKQAVVTTPAPTQTETATPTKTTEPTKTTPSTTPVTTPAETEEPGGLAGWAIALIIIVVLAIIAAVIIIIRRRRFVFH